MTIEQQQIKCPKCGETISIDDVLTHQIEERIKKEFEVTQKIKEEELTQKFEDLNKQTAEIAESKRGIELTVAKQVTEQMEKERLKLFK